MPYHCHINRRIRYANAVRPFAHPLLRHGRLARALSTKQRDHASNFEQHCSYAARKSPAPVNLIIVGIHKRLDQLVA